MSPPPLEGESLAGQIFRAEGFPLWVIGAGSLAEFIRDAGVWERLIREAFGDTLNYARGVVRASWPEAMRHELALATPRSLQGQTFCWTGDIAWSERIAAVVSESQAAVLGPPTEDAWERFHAKIVSALSARP